MSRTELQTLRVRVRRLIGDTATPLVFTDDELDEALDEFRRDYVDEPLVQAPDGGTSWYSDPKFWEAGYVVEDGSGAVVAPAGTSEPLLGRFVLDPSPSSATISGRSHDVYAASASLVDSWVAKVKLEFDFTADGRSFQRSKKVEALMTLSSSLWAKAEARSGTIG